MTRWIAVVGGVLFLALGQQIAAQFSVLPVYDTFDSREIDPARWVITAPRQLYETAVYQRGRKLHVESRGYGATDGNTGLAETGRILVSVPRDTASCAECNRGDDSYQQRRGYGLRGKCRAYARTQRRTVERDAVQ